MKLRRFVSSFQYAAKGIVLALQQERNMRFHVCAAFYVYLFSFFYEFSAMEYAVITILICGVIALELVNSALERAVEHPTPDKYLAAGAVKDMAAGAVLVFSLGSAVCGVLLFWDVAVFSTIWAFFLAYPLALIALLASLACAFWFIFGKEVA